LLFTVLITAWGGNYTWIKIALRDSGPWTFNALRYALAVFILGVALAASRGWRELLPVAGERVGLALIGLLQIAMITGLSTLALERIEASRTVLIVYSMPIWAILLSVLVLGQHVKLASTVGVLLSFLGLCLLLSPWAMDWSRPAVVLGSFLALCGTMAWALGALLYRQRRWQSDFWSQVFWQILIAAIVTLLGALVFETVILHFTTSYGVILIYNAIVPTVLAYWCWSRVLGRMSVPRASQVLMLSPGFGVLLSAAVLDEPLTISLLTSSILIISGAVLSYRQSSD
jgi:drug/metabolite transporter (DMT)-like permease